VKAVDLRVGIALAMLAAAVLWSAQAFPVVPGQQLGAGFLPKLVGAGLLLCGLGLVVRSVRGKAYDDLVAAPTASWRDIASALLILASIAAYIALVDKLGFLLVAPLCLLAVFRVLQVGWGPAIGFALGGTLLVHLAFYKLLRVPLPWGVLRPLY
jgi:putative tricarboxylic transport membrane protein